MSQPVCTPVSEVDILQVLHQLPGIHPKVTMSRRAARQVSEILTVIADRILAQAATLASHSDDGIMTWYHIQSATTLILPGELARHGYGEHRKTLTRFKEVLATEKTVDARQTLGEIQRGAAEEDRALAADAAKAGSLSDSVSNLYHTPNVYTTIQITIPTVTRRTKK